MTKALQWTGLEGKERRLIHTLSGGEQQKVALAGALAMGARILILDEALTMLDRRTRKSIRSLLERLRKDPGITLLEFTNNLEDLPPADRIIFMEQGEIRFDGPPVDFFQEPTGRSWLAHSMGVGALISALQERGVLSEPVSGRSDLVSYLLQRISR